MKSLVLLILVISWASCVFLGNANSVLYYNSGEEIVNFNLQFKSLNRVFIGTAYWNDTIIRYESYLGKELHLLNWSYLLKGNAKFICNLGQFNMRCDICTESSPENCFSGIYMNPIGFLDSPCSFSGRGVWHLEI